MKQLVVDDNLLLIRDELRNIRSVLEVSRPGVVYGFHIDGDESDPATAVTYLRDAVGMTPAHMDFTNGVFDYGSWLDAFFMPKPCMLKYDGTVDYYLDPDDYSKKEDGVTASDVANTSYGGNAMMEWGQNGKKIWYKIVPNGTSAFVYIADYQVDSDFVCWSFINNQGAMVDHFYTPCYFGTIVNNGSADVLRSLSGQAGSARCKNKTAAVERTMAKANNSTFDVWDLECYADITLINLLLILMGKNLNTQAVFGEGLHTSGSDAVNDAFISGQHDDKGLFFGTNSGAAGTPGNAVKVFGMENWYGFMWRRFNGLVNVNGTAKYKMTKTSKDGSSAEDYVVSDNASAYAGYIEGGTLPTASGTYIQQMTYDKNQMIPKTAAGSASTFFCDGLWTNNNQVDFALRGGTSTNGAPVGAVCLFLRYASSVAYWHAGAAPSCKPQA